MSQSQGTFNERQEGGPHGQSKPRAGTGCRIRVIPDRLPELPDGRRALPRRFSLYLPVDEKPRAC